MQHTLQRNIQILAACLLLACGVLFCAALDRGSREELGSQVQFAALQNQAFTISLRRGRLLLSGTTYSAEHEAALLQIARDEFEQIETHSDFHPGVLATDGWVVASQHLLQALAATDSGDASMRTDVIEFRAVTTDADALATRLKVLREHSNVHIDSDIIVVDSTVPFEQLCARSFAQLLFEPVSFRQSSSEIRSSSIVTLDRITEFASECAHVRIAITGHTDATGDESWNRHLSLARAQAIADHIANSGIDPQRLLVQGKGSSVPIADNTTAYGRGLNRRIEFELQ